jgi:uncharacterized protein (TIGR02265 family)
MELGSPQELDRRLGLIRPGDTVRGLLCSNILTVVRRQRGEEVARHCLVTSREASFTAFFSYPASALLRLVYSGGWALADAHGGFEGAVRYLGQQATPDVTQSVLGKTLLVLAGGHVRQLVSGLVVAHRTLVGHGTIDLRWTGPQRGLFSYQGNLIPHPYWEGALLQMFALSRASEVEVRGRSVGAEGMQVDFSWQW